MPPLGADLVSTVDVDPVIAPGTAHLAEAGYRPTCVAATARTGLPDRRAVRPRARDLLRWRGSRPAWLAQTAPGGLVVTTLNRPIGAGLVRIIGG